METYAVSPYRGGTGDLPIDTFFWGASIFLALVVSGFLAAKAIEWLRNRRTFDGAAAEAGRMSRREQEELVTLKYGPRKERKAMKERRKAREQAQKRSKGPTDSRIGPRAVLDPHRWRADDWFEPSTPTRGRRTPMGRCWGTTRGQSAEVAASHY